MNPSMEPITEGQIGKLNELLRARLLKISSQFQKDPFQDVLEHQGEELVKEIVSVVIKRVEAVGNLIVRHVKINRNRTMQEVLDATGRAQYTESNVVKSAPVGDNKEEVDVVFFKIDLSGRNGYISDDDLEKEYDLRGLKPADLVSVSAVNEADPSFADEKPHGTHWKNTNGKWCFAAFDRLGGERCVNVYQNDGGWGDGWWFAGVRK